MAPKRRKTPPKKNDKKLFLMIIIVPLLIVFILFMIAWVFVAIKTGELPDSTSVVQVFKMFIDLFVFIFGSEQ